MRPVKATQSHFSMAIHESPLTRQPHQRWKRKSRPGRRPDIDFTKSEKAALARSLRCRRAGTLTSGPQIAEVGRAELIGGRDDPSGWEVLRDVNVRGLHGGSPWGIAQPSSVAGDLRGLSPASWAARQLAAARRPALADQESAELKSSKSGARRRACDGVRFAGDFE